MRHGKKFNHLGRTAPHRKAMLSNMAASLFLHKRISTTLAKAKELKKHVEPLVTRAKVDTTHNRRIVFRFLQNKEAIKVLFGEVVEKIANRPGGYTRIIKTGFRLGDNAEMCIIELVDFNELMLKESKPVKKTTRRSRRGSAKPASSEEVAAADTEEVTDAAADTEEITDTATDAEEVTDVAADVEEVAATADAEEVTETTMADDAPQAETDQDDIKNDADEDTESNEDKKAE